MRSKQKKPIYGNSQGAKSGELSSDLASKKSLTASKQEYAQSSNFAGKFNLARPAQSRKSLQSTPRSLFKWSIVSAICYWLITSTPPGKNLTVLVAQKITTTQTSIDKTKSDFDPHERGKRRQKSIDDRFDDAWKRAGGKPESKTSDSLDLEHRKNSPTP